jgi:hypothetical protein
VSRECSQKDNIFVEYSCLFLLLKILFVKAVADLDEDLTFCVVLQMYRVFYFFCKRGSFIR